MGLFQRLKDLWAGTGSPTVKIPEGHTPPARRRYRFSGLVQGVGFRFEAMLLADRLELTGWARNESDGTVTIEIQGELGRIDAFLRAMQTVPRFHIAEIQTGELPLSQAETGFQPIY